MPFRIVVLLEYCPRVQFCHVLSGRQQGIVTPEIMPLHSRKRCNWITTFYELNKVKPSLIRIGDLRVCLYASTADTSDLLDQSLKFWHSSGFHISHYIDEVIQHGCEGMWYLSIVSPHIPGDQAYPTWLPESKRRDCTKIHRRWVDALSFFQGVQASNTHWFRQCIRLYIDHGSPDQAYCLVDDDSNEQLAAAIFLHTLLLAAWWHTLRGGLYSHSVGVAQGDKGFLFLGDSEAGKTTVAQLSVACGYPALGDDLNMVIRDQENSYRLVAVPSPVISPTGYSMLRPPLRGVFTLVQDDRNYLAPVSHRQTARALFDSFLQTPSSGRLPDEVVGHAFRTCCNIARSVPGYELHFCKSPDFWKVIDERFSD
ncbi:hypothetical protein QUF90_22060 [Desulfococcaceae bacterium HSG9]|nr:hypothetical protein [Desulfococcaceae bacterium HSG9]